MQLLVPLKNLYQAKARLRGSLDDEQRMSLVVAMATDLLLVLGDDPDVGSVAVIAGDHWGRHLPRTHKLRVLHEGDLDATGLNPLLESAVLTLGSETTLVLHGDLPFFGPADLHRLKALVYENEVVLCPDEDHQGTNGMAFRSACRPRFRFGQGSFPRHRQTVREHGWSCALMQSMGCTFDMDTADDLHRLINSSDGPQATGPLTTKWLEAHRSKYKLTPKDMPAMVGGPAA